MSRGKKSTLAVMAILLAVGMLIAAGLTARKIEQGKLTAQNAFYQAMRDGSKTKIDGISYYENDSIGRNDITWRIRTLEGPIRQEYLTWLTEKRAVYTAEEAIEYAWYLLGTRGRQADNEQLVSVVHLKKDNLWMFEYWLVGSEGGLSGYVVDGNTGDILKGWVEE